MVDYRSFLPDLTGYKKYPETKNCYLDGKYFNTIFQDYPGLIEEPLVLSFQDKGFEMGMRQCNVNTECEGLLRTVIETPSARHSTLCILDYQNNMAYWFNPFISEYDDMFQRLISKYLDTQVIRVPEVAPNVKSYGCDMSGFCNAYVTKYAYDYLSGHKPDLSRIKSFAGMLETEFPLQIAEGEEDITFGLFDDPRTRGALIGGLGGAAIGGLLGGGTGALVGAGVGGLGGYALSGNGYSRRPYYGGYGRPYYGRGYGVGPFL